MYVVVEVNYRTDEVERAVEGVSEVVGVGEGAGRGAVADSVFFGVLRWCEVFLLERVSKVKHLLLERESMDGVE